MDEQRGFRVQGRVQGVGFRWWTQRTASALGLRGDVRNCPDGSVEVQAVGPAVKLDALEESLRRGPSLARVDAVVPIAAEGSFSEDRFLLEGR